MCNGPISGLNIFINATCLKTYNFYSSLLGLIWMICIQGFFSNCLLVWWTFGDFSNWPWWTVENSCTKIFQIIERWICPQLWACVCNAYHWSKWFHSFKAMSILNAFNTSVTCKWREKGDENPISHCGNGLNCMQKYLLTNLSFVECLWFSSDWLQSTLEKK